MKLQTCLGEGGYYCLTSQVSMCYPLHLTGAGWQWFVESDVTSLGCPLTTVIRHVGTTKGNQWHSAEKEVHSDKQSHGCLFWYPFSKTLHFIAKLCTSVWQQCRVYLVTCWCKNITYMITLITSVRRPSAMQQAACVTDTCTYTWTSKTCIHQMELSYSRGSVQGIYFWKW